MLWAQSVLMCHYWMLWCTLFSRSNGAFPRVLVIWWHHLFLQLWRAEEAVINQGPMAGRPRVWAQYCQPHHTAQHTQSLFIRLSLKPAMTSMGPTLTIRLCLGHSLTPHQDSPSSRPEHGRCMVWSDQQLSRDFFSGSCAGSPYTLGHLPAMDHPHMAKIHIACSF